MDLITIFRVLFRRIWYLMGIPLFVVILVFIMTSGYPRIFRSSAQLATGFTVTKEINLTDERFNLYESGVKFSNLIETIKSPRVVSLLSYQLLLHDLDTAEVPFTTLKLEKENQIQFLQSLDMDWIRTFCQNSLDSMRILNTYNPREGDIQKLMEFYGYDFETLNKQLLVRRVNNTDYVSIDSFTENRFLSAYMVNTICSEFLRYRNSRTNSNKEDVIETYARLVAEKRTELARATSRLQNFKASNSMINSELEQENIVSRISDIEDELKEERQNLRAKNLQLQDIDRRLSGVTSTGITNADVIDIRNQINEMNERYLRNGSTVLRDSLAILRETQRRYIQMVSETNFNRSFDQLVDEKSALQVDIQIISQNIEDLEDAILRSSSEIGGFASKEARIASLEREVSLASEDYRDAQENYSRALSVSVSSGNSISQILQGLPATQPEPSKRLIVSAASGVSTVVFLILVIVLLEYLDVSIKSAANFGDKTKMQLIGSLNHISTDGGEDQGGGVKRFVSAVFEPLRKAKAILLRQKNETSLTSANRKYFLNSFDSIPKSETDKVVFRDQLRKLRYVLINSQKKVILFTSTKRGEGKTSIIAALAASLNQSHKRVLIIDTNFANPSITKVFKGLKVLEEFFKHKRKSNSEASKTFTAMFANNVGLPYIDVLGCKGGEYTPLEIIEGDSLASLIEDIRDKYDFVFFEGAALNTNSGSRELSSYVDGVVTVFSAKSTLDQLDYESIEFVQKLGDKNLGSVLNDIELRDMKS